jgi:hypothetical protein
MINSCNSRNSRIESPPSNIYTCSKPKPNSLNKTNYLWHLCNLWIESYGPQRGCQSG